MWFSGFSFSYFVSHSWGIPMMKITGLSHLFKWENLHNWWLTKYFFAPLYIYIYLNILFKLYYIAIHCNEIIMLKYLFHRPLKDWNIIICIEIINMYINALNALQMFIISWFSLCSCWSLSPFHSALNFEPLHSCVIFFGINEAGNVLTLHNLAPRDVLDYTRLLEHQWGHCVYSTAIWSIRNQSLVSITAEMQYNDLS